MTLKERIEDRLKQAMRAQDKTALKAARMMLARAKNVEIDAGHPLSDAEMTQVLVSLSRQYQDSIEQFGKGGREDLVVKEKAELVILEEFLPRPLTIEELKELVARGMAETGAAGPAEFGKMMKWMMPHTVGRADGKEVSALVRSLLEAK